MRAIDLFLPLAYTFQQIFKMLDKSTFLNVGTLYIEHSLKVYLEAMPDVQSIYKVRCDSY